MNDQTTTGYVAELSQNTKYTYFKRKAAVLNEGYTHSNYAPGVRDHIKTEFKRAHPTPQELQKQKNKNSVVKEKTVVKGWKYEVVYHKAILDWYTKATSFISQIQMTNVI